MAPPVERSFAAILAAGGKGTRYAVGQSAEQLPKQFINLNGHPIYVWSLAVLLQQSQIDEVVIVAPSELVSLIEDQISGLKATFPGKALSVVAGGDTRQKSVYSGLIALNRRPPEFVLVHDAARPFLTSEIISRAIEGAIKYGACTTGISPADTIKKISGDKIDQTIDRQALLLVQTPQAARFDWLLAAHELARSNGFATTDDAAVLEAAGHQVGIVRGANSNVKVTEADDLILAEALASIVFKDRL